MNGLALKIPPALLMLLFGATMKGLDWLMPAMRYTASWQDWAARSVFLLGVMVMVVGMVAFRQAKTTVDPTRPEQASSMVSSGIFSLTRNPMYLGFVLILCAFALKFGNLASIVMIPLFVLYLNRFQIKPEERALEQLFGADYENYKSTVRRWL